jgi:RNA polymerase sigma factor (sigma-70 family)
MLNVSHGHTGRRTGVSGQAETPLGLTLERYTPLIIRICRKQLRGGLTRDIEDAVHETALQFVAGGYAIIDPRRWLITVAVRTSHKTLRSRVAAAERSAAAIQRKHTRNIAAFRTAPAQVELDTQLLAERYWPLVARICRSRLRGLRNTDIEDAIQETFLRLAEADRSCIANLEAWLTTVAVRTCSRALRSRYKERAVEAACTAAVATRRDPLADAVHDADERLWLAKVAPLIPTADLQLLHLLYVQDKSHGDVARYFNVSNGDARVRAYRARQHARQIIDGMR